MHPITIQRTLLQHHGERVVIAKDSEERSFVGMSHDEGEAGAFVFVQIDRVTMLELERGTVDPHTAAGERCAGVVVRPARWQRTTRRPARDCRTQIRKCRGSTARSE